MSDVTETINKNALECFSKIIKKALMEHLSPVFRCMANTKGGTRCAHNAMCNNNTVCKKHKNVVVHVRKTVDVVYHNHSPIFFGC